jgi:hypothetical protein
MRKLVLFLILIVTIAVSVGAQVQMQSPPTAIDIHNPGSVQSIQLNTAQTSDNTVAAILPAPLVCDSAAPLLDVLNIMADPVFVKKELTYEDDNKLDSEAIYKRRLEVIKVLAGKAGRK